MAVSYLGRADLPRGLRNNNPGNLKRGSTLWQGQIGDDGTFVTFSNVAWGVRAMATVIANDINKGLNTIALLISSYAPSSENNTAAYIATVSKLSGFAANQVLPKRQDTLKRLIKAQLSVELGEAYAPMVHDSDIESGLQLMNSKLLNDFGITGRPGSLLLVVIILAIWLSQRK